MNANANQGWSEVLTLQPLQVVERIVENHRKHAPELGLEMAVWLNPVGEPAQLWQRGVELLEICRKVVADPEPDFRATLFQTHMDPEFGLLPSLRLILTSPGELNLASHMEEQTAAGFVKKLERDLRSGAARIVFSSSGKKDFGEYSNLLAG